MDMSWPDHFWDRRRALTAATGLVTGTLLPLAGASRGVAAPGPAQGPAVPAAADFTNPVVWQDFADLDIIRVGATYYASASTMHYSPGAPCCARTTW